MHPKLMLIYSTILTLVLVGVALIAGVVPADANVPNRPPRTDRPGAGFIYGVPTSFFGTTPLFEGVGGYLVGIPSPGNSGTGNTFTSTGTNADLPAGYLGVMPSIFTLSEPYLASGRVRVGLIGQNLPMDQTKYRGANYCLGNSTACGTSTPHNFTMNCATTAWSKTFTTVTNSGLSANGTSLPPANYSVDMGSCQFLQSLSFAYITCTGVNSCTKRHAMWSAEQWWNARTSYPVKPGDELWHLCQGPESINSPECVYVDPPDELTFEQACANAPATDILNWSWLGPWVAHYARCMFVPPQGWDHNSSIQSAWDDGTPGQVTGAVLTIVDTFNFNESCGMLMGTGTAAEILPNLNIDTCSWTWGYPLKPWVAAAIIAAGGWWVIRFYLRSIVGVVNRKTVTPLDSEKS